MKIYIGVVNENKGQAIKIIQARTVQVPDVGYNHVSNTGPTKPELCKIAEHVLIGGEQPSLMTVEPGDLFQAVEVNEKVLDKDYIPPLHL